jgi:hypothetical protein
MNWTFEKPTKTGWYWYRLNEEDKVPVVSVSPEHNFVGTWADASLDHMAGQWAGPLLSTR